MRLVIFGCGIIANRIAESCKYVDNIELVGFASKDINKAKEYAIKYNCDEFGLYDYFLDKNNIDAIYIATYNISHYELIKKCILKKKNVICEKPMLSSIDETMELFSLAKRNHVCLMEALKSVFLPMIIKTKKYIQDNKIGKLIELKASFMRKENFDKSHWIFDLKTGGVLKDLGSYCVGTMNYLIDDMAKIDYIQTNRDSENAESYAKCKLIYGNIPGYVEVSNEKDGKTCLEIIGNKGSIYIENFWKASKGIFVIDEVEQVIEDAFITDFYYELKHFADIVDNKGILSSVMDDKASIEILKITSNNTLM